MTAGSAVPPMACDLCGSLDQTEVLAATIARPLAESDFTVFGEQREYPRLVRCRACRLVFANPRDPVPDLVAKYRALSVSGYLTEEASRRATCEVDVAAVRRHLTGGRLLDIGCSAGLFLGCLDASFEPHGIEPGAHGAAEARRRLPDADIRQGTAESTDYPPGTFDAITMWDVIEHMPSPRASLLRIAAWLKDGGYLFLVTPDFGSLFARLSGRRWPHLIRQHLYYFERPTLRHLLETCGFEHLSTTTYTRYFTLGYVAKRTHLVSPDRTAPSEGWLASRRIPINLGDAMFVVARRRAGRAETV